MTDRATLLALAERVEKAKKPDHALNVAITKAVFVELGLHHRQKGSDLLWSASGQLVRVLAYTHSLDDAMTLVPEGAYFTVVGKIGDGRSYVTSGASERPPFSSWGSSPALALTAAALRARAAMGEEA